MRVPVAITSIDGHHGHRGKGLSAHTQSHRLGGSHADKGVGVVGAETVQHDH
jgi:hypothetical protein